MHCIHVMIHKNECLCISIGDMQRREKVIIMPIMTIKYKPFAFLRIENVLKYFMCSIDYWNKTVFTIALKNIKWTQNPTFYFNSILILKSRVMMRWHVSSILWIFKSFKRKGSNIISLFNFILRLFEPDSL